MKSEHHRAVTKLWGEQKGLNTKIHITVDLFGMPVRIIVTDGTVADCSKAGELIDGIDADYLLADIGYDTEYVNNLAEDIIHDIENEHEERLKNGYKQKMLLNRNVSIGILKDELIHAILESDTEKQSAMMQSIYGELSRNVVPIRPDRHYERNKSNLRAKYSNTHKRSF